MRANVPFLLFLISIIAAAPAGRAQHNMGVATGMNSAMNSLYLNPASISGASEKVAVNLFSLNVGVDNNLGTLNQLGNIGNGDVFHVSGGKSFSMMAPAVDLHLPGVMVSLDDKLKQSFAFTTRLRVMNQFNHFDPNLYTTATSSDHTSAQNYNYQSSGFNWTAHLWSEVGITYALQPLDLDHHKVKVGVTLKYLGGIDYLSLKGNNLDVNYKSGSDTFYASHSDLEFASNAVSSSNAINNGVKASDVTGSLFGSKAGSGLGMDIGVTYSYIMGGDNAKDGDGHKLTAAFSVMDIGAIKYNEGNNYVVNVSGNGYLTGQGLADNIKDWNDFRNYMVGQGFKADTGARTTKLHMPTSMIAGLDYNIYKRFYINATYITNLANRQNYGNSYYDQVTITPRYDSRVISAALPITYGMLAKDIKVGLGFRFSGFFFGSDDMLALMSSNQHGFNFYMGGYVPIYRKHRKDKVGSVD